MSRLVMVDTDVLIDAARNEDSAIGCLQQIERQATIGVSVITHMELMIVFSRGLRS